MFVSSFPYSRSTRYGRAGEMCRMVVGCVMHRVLQHRVWDRLLRVYAVIGEVVKRRGDVLLEQAEI